VTNLILVGIVLVFLLNYALVRVPGWERRGVPYWLVQGVNASAAAYVVAVGIPGVERIGDFFLALIFVYHGIQNELRARATNAPSDEDRNEARRKAYEDAIEAGRADAREEMNRP
jgi:hypothetical protein